MNDERIERLAFRTGDAAEILTVRRGERAKRRKREQVYREPAREIPVFDIGPCKVGIVICYDNQFPEIARVLALRGAEVLLMPHAARLEMWNDTPESEAAARRYTHDYFLAYAMRARENACFAILADQVGRAGYVGHLPRDSPNQPHHAGTALVSSELVARAPDFSFETMPPRTVGMPGI